MSCSACCLTRHVWLFPRAAPAVQNSFFPAEDLRRQVAEPGPTGLSGDDGFPVGPGSRDARPGKMGGIARQSRKSVSPLSLKTGYGLLADKRSMGVSARGVALQQVSLSTVIPRSRPCRDPGDLSQTVDREAQVPRMPALRSRWDDGGIGARASSDDSSFSVTATILHLLRTNKQSGAQSVA